MTSLRPLQERDSLWRRRAVCGGQQVVLFLGRILLRSVHTLVYGVGEVLAAVRVRALGLVLPGQVHGVVDLDVVRQPGVHERAVPSPVQNE